MPCGPAAARAERLQGMLGRELGMCQGSMVANRSADPTSLMLCCDATCLLILLPEPLQLRIARQLRQHLRRSGSTRTASNRSGIEQAALLAGGWLWTHCKSLWYGWNRQLL